MFDTVVKGGLVASTKTIERVDLGIRDGRVMARERDLPTDRAARVVNAAHRLVLPGAFDVHFHPMYGDSLERGSVAAAHGGITSMVPFVYAYRGLGLGEAIDEFVDGDGSKSVLDYGIHLGVLMPTETVEQIPDAFDRGVTSFKFFLAYRRRGMMTDDELFIRAMDMIGSSGGLMMIHAENGLAIDYLQDRLVARNKTDIEHFELSRPKAVEFEAVFRSICLASVVDCPIYLVHQTTGEAVDIIRRAKDEGQFVVGETCPQYLLLTNDDLVRQGPTAILTPPYRTAWDNDRFWEGLADGTISTIGSDHSPHPRENKEQDDVFTSPVGTPQTETMLPLVYDRAVNKGRMTLQRLVAALCENPARCFGLYPRKGNLDVGADADVCVVDPAEEWTIEASKLHSMADYNTYEGWTVLGRPVHTMQRGRDVLADGEVVAEPGAGSFMAATHPPMENV